jgi:UPF0716 family protein affecting phage T7 exclusion
MEWDIVLGCGVVIGAVGTVIWLYLRSVAVIEMIRRRNLRTSREIQRAMRHGE